MIFTKNFEKKWEKIRKLSLQRKELKMRLFEASKWIFQIILDRFDATKMIFKAFFEADQTSKYGRNLHFWPKSPILPNFDYTEKF